MCFSGSDPGWRATFVVKTICAPNVALQRTPSAALRSPLSSEPLGGPVAVVVMRK